MTIDFTKPVQTRDGRPVRIICTDAKNSTHPIVGVVVSTSDGKEYPRCWTKEGEFISGRGELDMNLIQVPQRHKHYEAIIAYAEGKTIQWRSDDRYKWEDKENPGFYTQYEYRVKP